MNEIRKIIKNRIETLQRGIDTAKLDAKGFPEGQLRITGKNIPEYYRILGDKQEYLGRDKAKTIISLAQKSYNKDFIKKATTELTYFEKILKHLPEGDAESVFQKLPLRRQNIVEPYILPDEVYKKRWEEMEYNTNPYNIEDKKYATRKGDMVRSKSEKILADMLYEMKIPYHYEQELRLGNRHSVYPDFTLLDISTRKEVYWEHLGLLDDHNYLCKNLRKLDEYRHHGIYQRKNLIVTYETSANPLDTEGIRRMLSDMFK